MTRLRKFVVWGVSKEGRHDIGAVLAALVTLYTAIHRAGV